MFISVCVGSSCHLRGSYRVIEELQKMITDYGMSKDVELRANFCVGRCQTPISVSVDGQPCVSLHPADTAKFFRENILGAIVS